MTVKAKVFACAFLGATALSALADGETYYLRPYPFSNRASSPAYGNKTSGATMVATMTNTNAWMTKSGFINTEFDASARYVIADTCTLIAPNATKANQSVTFEGGTMAVGEVGGTIGEVIHNTRNLATLTYAGAGGLEFANGYYMFGLNTNVTYDIYGDVTVTAPAAEPFRIYWQLIKGMANFRGSLSGVAGTKLVIGGRNPEMPSQAAPQDVNVLNGVKFLGNTSAYLGDIEVVSENTDPATATAYGTALMCGSVLSGKVSIGSGVAFGATAAGDTLTVGSLKMEDGSALVVPVDTTDGTMSAGLVSVTDALTTDGAVNVCLGGGVSPDFTGSATILTVPVGSRPALSAFVCTDEFFELVPGEESGGHVPLVLRRTAAAYQTASDPLHGKTKSKSTSSTTNATHWSNGIAPNLEGGAVNPDAAEVDYRVTKISGSAASLHTLVSPAKHTVGGRSWSFGNGASLISFGKPTTMPGLAMYDGSEIHLGQSLNATIVSESLRAPSGTVTLRSYSELILTIDAPISGRATLLLAGVNSTGSPTGYYRFAQQNPDFLGKITVSPPDNASSPGWSGYLDLLVGDALELGGNLPHFTPDAIQLTRLGGLRTVGSPTFAANSNRGIYINGADWGGRLNVEEAGHVLTLKTQLLMNGPLYKLGAGTLVLGGTVRFGTPLNTSDLPAAGRDLLEVREGKLTVASAGAVDGLRVSLAAGTRFAVKPDISSEESVRYGARNVKTDTPFVLADGMEKLPFDLDLSAVDPAAFKARFPDGGRLALMTVSADAADAVSAVFSTAEHLANIRGYTCTVDDFTDPETGAKTFAVKYKPKGMVLIFR